MRENRKCFQSHAYDMHLLEIKSTNCGARLSLEVRKKKFCRISEHCRTLTNQRTLACLNQSANFGLLSFYQNGNDRVVTSDALQNILTYENSVCTK